MGGDSQDRGRLNFTLPPLNAAPPKLTVPPLNFAGKSHPKIAEMLGDARTDVLAFAGFLVKHWRQTWSTNPMERVNKEITRRTDVVGIFPNPAALLRLAGAVPIEQHDEWEAGGRRCVSQASMAELETATTRIEEEATLVFNAAWTMTGRPARYRATPQPRGRYRAVPAALHKQRQVTPTSPKESKPRRG